LTWPSSLELIAFVVTAANVWLTVKENIWCWPTGIVSVVLYAIVFYDAKFYSSAALHVTATPKRWWPPLLLLCIVLTYAIGRFTTMFGASLPYWDAGIAAVSIVAQWMMAKKLLENWTLWIIVNIVSIGAYAAGRIYLTSLLYAILLVMAWRGYVEWKRSLRSASV